MSVRWINNAFTAWQPRYWKIKEEYTTFSLKLGVNPDVPEGYLVSGEVGHIHYHLWLMLYGRTKILMAFSKRSNIYFMGSMIKLSCKLHPCVMATISLKYCIGCKMIEVMSANQSYFFSIFTFLVAVLIFNFFFKHLIWYLFAINQTMLIWDSDCLANILKIAVSFCYSFRICP